MSAKTRETPVLQLRAARLAGDERIRIANQRSTRYQEDGRQSARNDAVFSSEVIWARARCSRRSGESSGQTGVHESPGLNICRKKKLVVCGRQDDRETSRRSSLERSRFPVNSASYTLWSLLSCSCFRKSWPDRFSCKNNNKKLCRLNPLLRIVSW